MIASRPVEQSRNSHISGLKNANTSTNNIDRTTIVPRRTCYSLDTLSIIQELYTPHPKIRLKNEIESSKKRRCTKSHGLPVIFVNVHYYVVNKMFLAQNTSNPTTLGREAFQLKKKVILQSH